MAIIDINNVNIQKLKLADLINDAAERKDEAALKWLHEQAMKKVERKDKDEFRLSGVMHGESIEFKTTTC